jgi:hypothetical protein
LGGRDKIQANRIAHRVNSALCIAGTGRFSFRSAGFQPAVSLISNPQPVP